MYDALDAALAGRAHLALELSCDSAESRDCAGGERSRLAAHTAQVATAVEFLVVNLDHFTGHRKQVDRRVISMPSATLLHTTQNSASLRGVGLC